MSGRIEERFAWLRGQGKKAFIPYIMTGDPNLRRTEQLIRLLEDSGADIIELGVPFSDPLADGPTIQRAAERALARGTSLSAVIRLVSRVRRKVRTPIVLMTYYNPVFVYGESRFVANATDAGVDGVIIPDLPPDEAGSLIRESRHKGLDTIFLLAPTSTEDRMRIVCEKSRGFVYFVSLLGITGSALSLSPGLKAMIRKARMTGGKPVCVGFGISTPEDARAVSRFADGVIVGSAIVRALNEDPGRVVRLLAALREAI